ncbi:2-oxoacid:ferredoxin oxidoreductase subunit beta [Desulfoprunum benzoelyticum]|uniref:2-oxoglutarate ferredoxin oxidoreductase subunit beta n=1 Tax=Desulfoprunum benzoelyticum TaxID=1506996 RepID=A0A840V8H7_9BACT|nr:2-oxoacid:ferredoxin oxidoreductase subunit beta [Desulfoprunum benzoelyticum]MBB5349271.1 2-oxoglutarate ferredoxin oxidoreductase subunit beta [Desulfoprunum benzoelyticum]MBM9530981.1 2-oxoacid:ferredoxin oxidoreductase subunit beta [Desulfoprunum benzoelyticum]
MSANTQPGIDHQGAHPLDDLIRTDRIPHIWCPGCGTGTAFSSCLTAIKATGIPYNQFTMVSGIGCSGRAAGYIKIDSFHTTHGRAIPFASGIKMARPDLNVIVFSGDGDLFAIGGNHFIHAARRNMDMTVICVNNLIYGMTGGQVAATTPSKAKTTTTPFGNPDAPFNLPLMAYAAGASYVARWTILHVRDLTNAINEALLKKGFSFIEVLAPCPVNYGRRNKQKSLDTLRLYREKTIIRNGADPARADIDFGRGVILGTFIDRDRDTCDELYDATCRRNED